MCAIPFRGRMEYSKEETVFIEHHNENYEGADDV